jgi:hypothetical protein
MLGRAAMAPCPRWRRTTAALRVRKALDYFIHSSIGGASGGGVRHEHDRENQYADGFVDMRP